MIMDVTKIDTGDINFAGWTVRIVGGQGVILDSSGAESASFTVQSAEQITLLNGDAKFADMALIALRSFLRYGIHCG